MDMLGDAEPVDLTDEPWDEDEQFVEVRERPAAPLLTPEAAAVTSLTLSIASLLIVSVAQFLSIFLTGSFGFTGNGDDENTKSYLMLLGPTGVLALAGALAGLHGWRRRAVVGRWVGGVATAGLVLGALVAAAVAVGFVLLLVLGTPTQNDF